MARLGRQGPQLGDHLVHVFGIDPAGLAQPVIIMARQKRQVLDQRLHGRVEAVAFLELQRQAFLQRTGHHPGRLEALHQLDHALNAVLGHAQLLGRGVHFQTQIAVLLHHFGQPRPDKPGLGVSNRHGKLGQQVIFQRDRRGAGRVFHAGIVKPALARACTRPVRVAADAVLVGHALIGMKTVGISVQGGFGGGADAVVADLDFLNAVALFALTGHFGLFGPLLAVIALQKGILFQFGLDEFRKLDIRQLQQFDRLLQLRRHDQGLALSDLKSLRDRHNSLAVQSVF